jgi:hypothetical protein
MWTITNTLIRISTALFLTKIFGVGGRCWSCTIVLCFSALHGIASVLDLLLICRPISAQWKSEVTAICGNQQTSFVVIETSAVIIDCMICAIAFFMVLRLMGISARVKVKLICMLDVGILYVCFSNTSKVLLSRTGLLLLQHSGSKPCHLQPRQILSTHKAISGYYLLSGSC